MFGIFNGLRHRMDCRRLHRRALEDPYPRTYIDLCRRLVGHGRIARAQAIAEEGLARFPHCEELRDLLRHTWRQEQSHTIERLQRRCREENDPEPFVELTHVFLACEEYDEALATAEELSRRRADLPEGWLLQGLALLERFRKDGVANDAQRGLVHLKHVLELDSSNFDAHFRLAQVYRDIGVNSKALFHIYRALDLDSDNVEAQSILEQLVALPLENENEATLLRRMEENSRGDRDGPAHLSTEKRSALLASLIRLSHLNGVRRAACAGDGVVIVASRGEGRILDGDENDPLCDIALGFHKAAATSARRMGIGSFQSAILETGPCMLQCHAVGPVTVLVESDDPGRADVIKAECSSFVASCLGNPQELTHA